jgi:hypothetical protein
VTPCHKTTNYITFELKGFDFYHRYDIFTTFHLCVNFVQK